MRKPYQIINKETGQPRYKGKWCICHYVRNGNHRRRIKKIVCGHDYNEALNISISLEESEKQGLYYPEYKYKELGTSHDMNGYPIPPHPNNYIAPITGFIEGPSVYFLWKDGVLEYVGRSINLKRRLVTQKCSHQKLKKEHAITYLCFQSALDAMYAEHYYIGLLKPPLNEN